MNKVYGTILLGCIVLLSGMPSVFAQEKVVSVRIVKEADGYKSVIDTTFAVGDEGEIEDILDRLDRDNDGDESVETIIVIRDSDSKRKYAKNSNPNRNNQANDQRREPGMIGVYLDTENGRKGVRITGLVNGGAAQAAGLERGDVIIKIDDDEVRDYHELSEAKSKYGAGDRMEVTFRREDDERTTKLVLRTRAEQKEMATIMRWEEEGTPRAFLGVYTDEVTAERARTQGMDNQQGVYVEGVVPGAGAEQAGIREGDVITQLNGRVLDASHEMTEFLRDKKPGDRIAITYLRDGRSRTVNSVLGRREMVVKKKEKVEEKKAFLGIYLSHHDDGIYVTGVVANSAAEEAGLEKGDVIVRINDIETEDSEDLSEALKAVGPGGRATIYYLRDDDRRTAQTTLGSKTYTKWVTVERYGDEPENEPTSETEEEEVEIEVIEIDEEDMVILFENFSDQQRGQQLRDFMENPTLEMDLFEFFPNPNAGRFTLRFSPIESGDLQIRIYGPEGREIYTEQIDGFSGTYDKAIDISRSVSEGVYFLQVSQGARGMVERIIIK